MLAFMRKHQKYFYVIITFVIVVSFSFFGTYSTLSGNAIHEQVAFTTVTGDPVTRGELEEMVYFISTDSEDKKLFGGVWGPNFLNDGVIRKDLLESGLATILINAYSSHLQDDIKNRFAKEIRYKPYEHPQAKFLSSMTAWTYFAPAVIGNFNLLRNQDNPMSQDALLARINLFLAEKRFPAPYLRQVLAFQEKQNQWIAHDPGLDQTDLSLFGYHTVDDWFGPRFTRLMAEFILNAASLAEKNGYYVSKEEALTSLILNAQKSYQENRASPQVNVANASDYFEQQLTRMRLDKTKATKIWQKVLLFRRLFDDIGQSVFVSAQPYEAFNQFAGTVAQGDLYRLPEHLRFNDFRTFQQFETYLDAVAKKSKDSLILPKEFKTPQEVAKKTPELVKKTYKLEMSSVNQKNLQAKVNVRDTLNWELDNKNWEAIKSKFPSLGLKKGDTREERLALLDDLDAPSRGSVDNFARSQIVSSQKNGISDALNLAPARQESVSITLKGPSSLFAGLENGEDFMKLLDQAPLNQENEKLNQITFDGETYYKIKVLERSPDLEILTFQEAKKGPLLEELNNRALEIHYVQVRGQDPSAYQNSDKSWKNLEEVKDKVARSYFSKTLDAIKTSLNHKDGGKYKNIDQERLAAFRFVSSGDDLLKDLKKNPADAAKLTLNLEENKPNASFQDQFKWVRVPLEISRKNDQGLVNAESLIKQAPLSWSDVNFAPNGDVYFAFVKSHDSGEVNEEIQEQVARARFLLGNGAKDTYLKKLLPLIKEKNAISFDYLNAGQNLIEPGNDAGDDV